MVCEVAGGARAAGEPARTDHPQLSAMKEVSMKAILGAILMACAITLPLSTIAAPDEAQKAMIQRAQEARQKLSAAQAAQGAERRKLMQEHMAMMDQMTAQMQKAEPRAGMSAEQMRDWIDEHLKLMRDMMSQMMGEHHMMMQSMGMGATGAGAGGMSAPRGPR
jgi:hypothetical protein